MAAAGLAPVAVVGALEAFPALVGELALARSAPLTFRNLEAWQRSARPLSDAAKNRLREQARARYARANGISAREMNADIHHSRALEYAHVFPNADPNGLAGLWALRPPAHDIASAAWRAFGRELGGRAPTQAEVMAAKLRIDRMVEAYVRRAGVARSNKPPREGGPI
jgi:hypothetical protein